MDFRLRNTSELSAVFALFPITVGGGDGLGSNGTCSRCGGGPGGIVGGVSVTERRCCSGVLGSGPCNMGAGPVLDDGVELVARGSEASAAFRARVSAVVACMLIDGYRAGYWR